MVFIAQAGCLLPLLIILNLFFGWMVFRPAIWLLAGMVLILLFIANAYLTIRKFKNSSFKKRGAIDIEARVVDKEG